MATSSVEPLEVEMEDPWSRPAGQISVPVRELEKRLAELPELPELRKKRAYLEAEGKTVPELAEHLLPFSYLEVRNLWLIERNPVLKLALADWKEKEGFFGSRVFDQKRLIERTKNVVYQAVGIYFIFQILNLLIVILIGGFARPSKESRLYLIFLSLAASILTILVITRKVKVIFDVEKTLWSNQLALREVVKRRFELARNGDKYTFRDNYYKHTPRRHSFFGNYLMDYGAMFVLFQTAWVFPLAVWRISK